MLLDIELSRRPVMPQENLERQIKLSEEIENILNKGCKIGTLGSPNYVSEFTIDILEDSIHSPLQGKIVAFLYTEGGVKKLVLAQIAKLTDRNVWHEHPALRAVIKKMGRIPHISGETDLKGANLKLVACYEVDDVNNRLVPTQLYTPPSSGIPIYEVTNELIEKIQLFGKFYFGYFFGTRTLIPLSIRPFDTSKEGLGEAHHFGIFGKTGYGKSIIAAMLSVAFARHKNMGVLIIDPQGEFANNTFSKPGFSFDYHKMLRYVRKDFEIIDLSNVALTGVRTFIYLLAKEDFFDILGVKTTEKETAVVDGLAYGYEIEQERVHNFNVYTHIGYEEFIEKTIREIVTAYADRKKADTTREREERHRPILQMIFNRIKELFASEERRTVDEVLRLVLEEGRFVILDLSKFIENITAKFRRITTDEAKFIIMSELLGRLLTMIKTKFAIERNRANAVIFIDEAHLYVPQIRPKESEKWEVKKLLTDAIKMTRKYGIGWVFITQSTADIDKIILKQLHNYIFVPGLSLGADAEHLEKIIGKENFEVYRNLPDPKVSGIYTFMVYGPIVGFSTVGAPIVIHSFRDGEEFIKENKLEEVGSTLRIKRALPGLRPSEIKK